MNISVIESTEGLQVYWQHDGDYGWLDHPAGKTEAEAYQLCITTLLKKLYDIDTLARY